VSEKVIEKFVPLDMSDSDTVFPRCLKALQKVQSVSGVGGVTVQRVRGRMDGWVGAV